ncbi:coatomer subunit alpha [Nematocida major]|uniref:coatomer subunit alpha n=1 Tax=Nematocida major TaxID=1912982 RepID=UPI002007F242|nr:coatomer subunit alpha [Nematocida major]KAH9386155.1 coatomer subunit alpha [Nematocida major]
MEERVDTEECLCIMSEETQRVKSIAFHPSKKIIIAGLHNGAVQGWNYAYKTKVFELNEHEGPVRVVVFHHLIERFATAGDDCVIRVWDYKTKTVETVFKGHTDYVRSIEFHKHLPWLISASDDQTIRIWNFQSKKQIACLTGHTHYVMAARFINDNIFASVSLDQTIRVWDYSALVTKSQASVMDILGVPEVILKHIVDGHDRGINCIAVHPEAETFATGGDDSTIRIWEVTQDGVVEKETLQGHHSHVSALCYTKADTLISNSEDGTMKVWNVKKRKPVKSFKVESRYWCVALDRTEKLFAAGHDTGFTMYSMEMQRPVYTVSDSVLYLCKDREVLRLQENRLVKVASTQKDPLEVFVQDGVVILNYSGGYSVHGKAQYRGSGRAVFAGGKVCVATGSEIITKEIDGREISTYTVEADRLFEVEEGLLASKDKLLFRVENGEMAESFLLPEKCLFVQYNSTHIVAVCSKNIVVLNYSLQQVSVVEEIVAVNSLIFKDGCIFYSTPMHIKFAFTSGEGSSFISTDEPMWISSVDDSLFTLIAADGTVVEMEVDMVEWKFKKALEEMDVPEIKKCVDSGSLIGQAALSALIRKGFYEEGLHYVKDAGVRLELCLKTKRFADALQYAKELHSPEVYVKTGLAALDHEVGVSEECFKLAEDYARLLLLYISSGQKAKIESFLFECPDSVYCAVAAIITGNKEVLCNLLEVQTDSGEVCVVSKESEESAPSPAESQKEETLQEKNSDDCSFASESQDAFDLDEVQTINKMAAEIPEEASEECAELPMLNLSRMERCMQNVPANFDAGREIALAKECMSTGKASNALTGFLMAMHCSIDAIRKKKDTEETHRNLREASKYAQALFADRIKRTSPSDKVSVSCAIFYAGLDLDRSHCLKAIKSSIPVCYKKGNKHSAMLLAKELVQKYGSSDEKMQLLANSTRPLKDTYVIDTSLPFCVDTGEYSESAEQCTICKAWSSSSSRTCACCFVTNLQ